MSSFKTPSKAIPRCVRIWSLVAAASFAFCASPAHAIEQEPTGGLTLQAGLKETGSRSSNPLMVSEGAKSLWGSTTSPELILQYAGPTFKADLDTRVDQSFFNQTKFNSTDVHVSADGTKKIQRWMFALKKTVDYDTTRTSELTTYGLQPVVTRHLGMSIAPKISYGYTPLDTISLEGSASRSRYNDTNFSNYETFSVTPSYTHQIDPKNSGILSFQAHRYETTRNNATRVDSWGPNVGWQGIFSPRLQAHASVGAQASRQYSFGVAVNSWSWQYVFAGGLSFIGEKDRLNIDISRAQFPYGNGTEALQTSFSASERHRLNRLFSVDLDGRYQTSKYQTGSTGNLRSYAEGHTGLAYHATEQVDLTAGYRYRYETLTSRTKNVQDNTFTVGLVFRPDAWTLLK